jgi:hypothetical protein
MVGWRGAAGTAAVANWWTDGSNAIAFSRGSSAWVAINAEAAPVTQTFSTGLPPGTYCDVISGQASGSGAGCTGTAVTVGSSGQATVTVPATGAVGIDVDAMAAPSAGVRETVTVTVPASTASTGETVYLAGNLSALGTGQPDWAPSGIPMTPVSATEWTATIDAASDTTLSYKYDLGGTWTSVEETSSCGYVNNRAMSVNGGAVNDTVANWAGLGGC